MPRVTAPAPYMPTICSLIITRELQAGRSVRCVDAARELGVSQRTVQRWLDAIGHVYPLTRDGRAYRLASIPSAPKAATGKPGRELRAVHPCPRCGTALTTDDRYRWCSACGHDAGRVAA